MAKTKKQTKQEQAMVQSDQLEMGFSEGVTYGGSFELENGMSDMTYSFGDLGKLDLFSEEDMREKYPALKQAWEHYQSVLEVCKTKEKEEGGKTKRFSSGDVPLGLLLSPLPSLLLLVSSSISLLLFP